MSFTISDIYNESNGGALGARVTDAHTTSSTSKDNKSVPDYRTSPAPKDGAGIDAGSMEKFARLWKGCIGEDDTYYWFHDSLSQSDGECLGSDRTTSSRVDYRTATGGGDAEDSSATVTNTVISLGTRFSRQHDWGGSNLCSQSSSPGRRSTPLWERLLEALSRRGIYVHQILTAHECMLLERELADWWRSCGSRAGLRHERHQSIEEGFASPTIEPRLPRSPIFADSDPTKITPVAIDNAGNDGDLAFNSACKKAKPSCSEASSSVTGQAFYPGGVRLSASNEQDPSMTMSGTKGDNGTCLEVAESKSVTGEGPLTKATVSERPLDMRTVALGVHEVHGSGPIHRPSLSEYHWEFVDYDLHILF